MKTSRPQFVLTCSVAALITAAAASSAQAQAANADVFLGTTSNDWNDPTNWSAGTVPTGTDANVSGASGVTAVYGADSTTNPSTPVDIFAGAQGGTGRIDVTGGTLSTGGANWAFVGVTNGTGTLNVANTAVTTGAVGQFTGYGTGTGSFNVGYRFWFGGDQNAGDGNIGHGTLNVNTTGTITVPNDFYLAPNGTGGTATMNMDAGTFTQTGGWTFVGGDRQGDGGAASVGGTTGVINQSGGTITMANDTYLGRGNGSTGTLNMTGGSFSTGGGLILGTNGSSTGTVVQNGAGSSVTTGGDIDIGNTTGVGASGSIPLSTYTLNAGSVSVGAWVAIGRFGGNGELDINGGTFTKLNNGNGFFDVSAGNTTNASAAVVNLNGGVLIVPKVIDEVGAAGSGVFNFNGGILRANSDGTTAFNNNDVNPGFFQGLTTANVRGTAATAGSGANIDSNGFNITVAQPLVHSTVAGDAAVDGGLTKLGTGTLTLTGANTYTGATTVSLGTLALGINATTGVAGSVANTSRIQVAAGAIFDASGTGVTFTPGAGTTLTGTGTITAGPNALTVTGILAPGVTPAAGSFGTLTLGTTGALTLAGTTQFDLVSNTQKDLITTTGPTSLTLGGTLALTSVGGLTGTFALINGLTTAPTGNFGNVTGVPTGESATFSYASGTYSITLAAVPEPSTWAMGVFGIGMAAVWLRRRRVA